MENGNLWLIITDNNTSYSYDDIASCCKGTCQLRLCNPIQSNDLRDIKLRYFDIIITSYLYKKLAEIQIYETEALRSW